MLTSFEQQTNSTSLGKLALPEGEFQAYLFDLDGTVADSMPLHYLAWVEALAAHNVEFPEALFYEWGGIPPYRIVEMLNERLGLSMSPADVTERKEFLYCEMLPDLRPVASVLEYIHAAYGKIPFAIVSGSPRASILSTLHTLGLSHCFPVIVGFEDYRRGKPDPEPFLVASALLDIPPGRCLVFEDADAGIKSAEAAGMRWVRIPSPFEQIPLERQP